VFCRVVELVRQVNKGFWQVSCGKKAGKGVSYAGRGGGLAGKSERNVGFG
jgi:hypothetical protein